MAQNRIIVWHRRDLRTTDNTALSQALLETNDVLPLFIYADDILKDRNDFSPSCIKFMTESLNDLNQQYLALGGKLILRCGRFIEVLRAIVEESEARAIYYNEDYEPSAKVRDLQIEKEFTAKGLQVKAFKDQAIFAKDEILTQSGGVYTVFTPYKRKWLSKLTEIKKPYVLQKKLLQSSCTSLTPLTVAELGFECHQKPLVNGGSSEGIKLLTSFLGEKIKQYKAQRDFPAVEGTSLLSAHLRFGTISVREIINQSISLVNDAKNEIESINIETFISEIIWRDFYFQILTHFPFVETKSFQVSTRNIKWENREDYFEAWKDGRTGFPIVDAAMRQLNKTGWMHNRLRMIVASFLTKDLLIDWRWGELYFIQKLIDGDMAANNGGWQWSASTGTDAQPYFRIFNPISQSAKFDPSGTFIKSYIPELNAIPTKFIHEPSKLIQSSPLLEHDLGIKLGRDYPHPIIEHAIQREKALKMFKAAKDSSD